MAPPAALRLAKGATMEYGARFPIEFMIRIDSTVPRSTLQEHADHRLFFALRRFQDSVRRVTVRVTDQNGPRRGIDTRCVVTADLHRGGAVLVEATSAWPTAAIGEAARRLNEALRRRVDREHAVTRRRTAVARIVSPALPATPPSRAPA
jgi:ribosome-associated translation inhibitor RaiA